MRKLIAGAGFVSCDEGFNAASQRELTCIWRRCAKGRRAKCREDAVVYNAAVKSGRLSLRKYQMVVALIGLVVALVMLGIRVGWGIVG